MLIKSIVTVFAVAFEPETIKLMGDAFDRANARLGYKPPNVIQEYIANRILGAANRGERDVERLIAAAFA
jgi:hypothetical protein